MFSTVCLGSAMLCSHSITTMTEEGAPQNKSKTLNVSKSTKLVLSVSAVRGKRYILKSFLFL